jgi:transcription-repair coupling factor (superfamily II helicase)
MIEYKLLHLPKRLELLKDYLISQAVEKRRRIVLCINGNFSIEDVQNVFKEQVLIYRIYNIQQVLEMQTEVKIFITNIKIQQSFEIDNVEYISVNSVNEAKDAEEKLQKILNELSGFEVGDFIIHKKYGIGKFLGLEKASFDNIHYDCISLEYSDGNKLMLPVDNINLISKYKNRNSEDIVLDDINSGNWEVRKSRVRNKIQELAAKIIEIHAKRNTLQIVPIQIEKMRSKLDEFYNSFKHIETVDQTKATIDLERDFADKKPMNRLICGDVGFGKTEIAMRTIFAVAMNKKMGFSTGQVAVVAPTTFLAKQNFEAVIERLEGYGFNIRLLTRFATQKEQTKTQEEMASGELDVLISTHAVFSKCSLFNNLELLVIDEEQSFGVEQKEKIRNYWPNCHCLYLSATPIPRTFQSTLYGILDISVITTPPEDRLPVKNHILSWNSEVILHAIQREFARNGRVVFLTPKIEDIESIVKKIKAIEIKDIKIDVLTGKMSEDEVEEKMEQFEEGKINCIIATTILAQGVNIAKLNTIFICNADRFGLGQLYQIKGRVGRSSEQGYVYFFLDRRRASDENVIQRFKVINSAAFLGGGFAIANADLDIRGAGNILGKEQSGNIKEVGFDLYQEMLQEEILHSSKGESEKKAILLPEIETSINVFIPDHYIKDATIRLNFYRKFNKITSLKDWALMKEELKDRFGKTPQEIEDLEHIIILREVCIQNKIKSLKELKKAVHIKFYDSVKINTLALVEAVKNSNKSINIQGGNVVVLSFENRGEIKEKVEKLCQKVLT